MPKSKRKFAGDAPVKDKVLVKFINHIQRVIEAESFEMRKMQFLYSDLLEKQRRIIQEERQNLLLHKEDLEDLIDLKEEVLNQHPGLMQNLKAMCLLRFDKNWTTYLDQLIQVKEGIHLVRFGGQNPLFEFQRIADESFRSLNQKIAGAIQEKTARLMDYPQLLPEDLGMKKPSSTWTYVVSDNSFGDQLAIKMLNSGNIGFQVDFISAFFLFFVALFRKIKQWFKKR